MITEYLLALGLFAFIASVTPGPNNLMLLSSGTNFGWRRTIPHLMGVNFGFVLMLLLVGIGLMQLFEAWSFSLLILKTISISYLFYLAWKIATTSTIDAAAAEACSKPMTMVQAMLFQWVNPKAWAMGLTAISAYAPPLHPIWSVILVAIVFGLVNLPSMVLWVMLGTQLRRFFDSPLKLKIFNTCVAILLVLSLFPFFF